MKPRKSIFNQKQRKFLRDFSVAMTMLLSVLGYAFIIAAFLVAIAPNDILKMEASIPVWVIISMWWVGIGMFYLWICERLKVRS